MIVKLHTSTNYGVRVINNLDTESRDTTTRALKNSPTFFRKNDR